MKRVSLWQFGVLAAIVSVSILAVPGRAVAQRETITKMADALQKGDDAGAKKMAEQLKNDDLEDIMNLMGLRKANGVGGIGVGPTPGAIKPDSIERKVQELEKKAPTKEEMEALEKASYIIRAIALATPDKLPKGKQSANWKKYSAVFEKEAAEFEKATKTGDAKKVQTAAVKLNNACINCHEVYK